MTVGDSLLLDSLVDTFFSMDFPGPYLMNKVSIKTETCFLCPLPT